MIKAIIFDCFGVLYPDASWNFFFNLKGPVELTREHLTEFNERADLGKVTKRDYYNHLAQKTGISAKTIQDTVYGNFVLNESVLGLVKELSNIYKIGMITNAATFDIYILKRDDVEKYFDSIVVSAQVGVTKPHSKIYILTASELNVAPNECLYIDDHQHNVDGAIKAGMQSILFKNVKQLDKDLGKML